MEQETRKMTNIEMLKDMHRECAKHGTSEKCRNCKYFQIDKQPYCDWNKVLYDTLRSEVWER